MAWRICWLPAALLAHRRRDLLGGGVHVGHRAQHLGRGPRLPPGRAGDLGHQRAGAADRLHDAAQGQPGWSASWMPSLASESAALGRVDRVGGLLLHLAHHLADLLGGLDRALGQLAHLVGHDREAAPGLPGPGGLRWRR